VPGLGTSFGRGGATTAQPDLSNADAILIMGSSMAENHPIAFQWVIEAREKGAKIIHVDPRYTRTSAMADIWVPLRASSDIVFLGALVHYVLENNKDFRDYVVAYTMHRPFCAKTFVTLKISMASFRVGMQRRRNTIRRLGCMKARPERKPARLPDIPKLVAGMERIAEEKHKMRVKFESDPTLQHPRCVYQVLKRHFARYTPEMVERSCGVRVGGSLERADCCPVPSQRHCGQQAYSVNDRVRVHSAVGPRGWRLQVPSSRASPGFAQDINRHRIGNCPWKTKTCRRPLI
jgi:formate dehydrogenase major subunit